MAQECDPLQEQLDSLEARIRLVEQLYDSAPPPEKPDIAEDLNRLRGQAYDLDRRLRECLRLHPRLTANLSISGVEQTQATQFFRPAVRVVQRTECNGRRGEQPDNDIRLVSGKTTVIRAYVDVTTAANLPAIASLNGVLETRQMGSPGWDTPLTPYNAFAPVPPQSAANIDRGVANHTLNFRIPEARCRGKLEIRLTVFDAAHPGETGYTAPPVRRTLTFTETGTLKIRLLRIRYSNAARGLDLAAPSVADFWATAEPVLRMYPISGIDVVADSEELYDGDFSGLFDSPPSAIGTTGSVFTIIDRIQAVEQRPEDVKFFALIPGPPANRSGATGWGVAPNRAVGEVFQPGVMAQEIGHACGRAHAPCGNPGGVDSCYPIYDGRPAGSIGEYGFDTIDSVVFDPAKTSDFMTYCGPAWISPYTYEGLMGCASGSGTGDSGGGGSLMERGVREMLQVLLHVFRNGSVQLRMPPFDVLGTPTAPRGASSPYVVEVHDARGTVLASQRLRLTDIHKSMDDAMLDFAVALPWSTAAQRVVVMHDDRELHVMKVGASAPRVTLLAPRGGGPLSGRQTIKWKIEGAGRDTASTVRFSHDGGTTWQAVAIGLKATDCPVDLDTLPFGVKCLFQVLTSSGMRTGVATSPPFAVAPRPRQPLIISPKPGTIVRQDDSVHLFGVTGGPGGGSARPTGLTWVSSIDGYLGSGSQVVVHTLSPGTHRVVLSGDDRMRGVGSDSVVVTIQSRFA